MHGIRILEAVLCLLSVFLMANGLIGYDCSSPPYTTYTYSRLEVEKCEDTNSRTTVELVDILVLELPEQSSVKVEQCNLKVKYYIQSCDTNENFTMSESNMGPTSKHDYMQDVCHGMKYRVTYKQLNRNTIIRHQLMSGSIDDDGTCHGVEYSKWHGWWSNVVVHEGTEYVSRTMDVPVSNGNVNLPSGTVCKFKDEWCWNEEEGFSTWHVTQPNECYSLPQDHLYKGPALKFTMGDDETTIKYVTINDPKIINYKLTVEKKKFICGEKVYTSDNGRLLIVERDSSTRKDYLSFLNILKQMVELQSLHDRLEKQECELKRKDLEYALTIAPLAPSEAGFVITKKPGYTTIVNGDLLILVKCRPVNVELRQTEQCYSELPITYNNRDVFLQSRTKIIVDYASEKLCSNIFIPGYEIDRSWYEKIPSEPKLQIMNHYDKPTLLKPNDLINVDLIRKHYFDKQSKSLEEVNQFSAQLMFQIDKPAIAEEIALQIIEESSSTDE